MTEILVRRVKSDMRKHRELLALQFIKESFIEDMYELNQMLQGNFLPGVLEA